MLSRLLDDIDKSGLTEVCQGYAFDTARRIVETGRDLDCPWPDAKFTAMFEADTRATKAALSNPKNWGIAGQRWKIFCEEIVTKREKRD